MKSLKPVSGLLSAPDIPAVIQAHVPTFYKLGLNIVWFTCADYHAHSANVYFIVPGIVAKDQAAQLAELAGSPPPTDEEFEDMQQLMSPKGFLFAVTMKYPEGLISRVAFYALDLALEKVPVQAGRLRDFLMWFRCMMLVRLLIIHGRSEVGYTGEFGDLVRTGDPFAKGE